MNQIVRFGLVLGVICLIATLVLAVVYEITKPKIEAQRRAEEEAALKVVMPGADSFEAKSLEEIEYFDALKDGELAGYCLKVTGSGYGGYMHMIVGLDKSGTIKGVQIISDQETPGLGTKIKEVRSGEKEPYFLRQFKGKDATTVEIRKNIDAITGATISSKAVTDAVRKSAIEFMAKIEGRQ